MKVLFLSVLPVGLGLLLDWLLGDPQWLYHPVRLIGRIITAMESALRKAFPQTPLLERSGGACLAMLVPLLAAGAAGGILLFAWSVHPFLWLALESAGCYFLLAANALKAESMQVYARLQQNNLPQARIALSRIVGRDTEQLEQVEIVKATVETVSENTSDGVIAPLFYLFVGGSVLGWAYKAVNTLDSMVGYQNERYRYFGTASARLDDALNFIPARISALIMISASFLCGFNAKKAWLTWRRDHANHSSPNSAHTEAACAGALGIQLGGGASYFGEWKDKPTIGDAARSAEIEDIPRTCRLMQTTTFLSFLIFAILKGLALWLFCKS